ncbi:hypothetical protein D3C81_1119670 [compost metagenome]
MREAIRRPSLSPWLLTSASRRSSCQLRSTLARRFSRPSVSSSRLCPAFGRTIRCTWASGESPSTTLESTYSPCSASLSMLSTRRRTSVLKRSRGRITSAEMKRLNLSRRRNKRLRTRSCSPSTPMAVRNSSSSLDWNSSSRGSDSRMWRSALPLWLDRLRPERCITFS